MTVNVKSLRGVTVVSLEGEIDGKTAPEVQERVLPLVEPGSKILLDMGKVPYMSSAGLRMLLSVYRQVTGKKGAIVLAGVEEDIRDTMSVTGFLKFFVIHETVESGVKALEG
ncbi:MAG: anti-sigma factor antagonist [Rectinemataceae bacterium]